MPPNPRSPPGRLARKAMHHQAPPPAPPPLKSQSPPRNPATASTLHDFVDAAVGVGTTVGRAATVWGSELVNMVHREQAGNTITLSKVDEPAGHEFTFRGNTINLSKVSHLSLHESELRDNTLNASKLSDLTLTRGRFNQCNISGSSVSHITIEGSSPGPEAATDLSGIRAATLNASKFSRTRLTGGSIIDTCIIQASAVKDLELLDHSTLRDCRFNDCALASLRLDRSTFRALTIERSRVHGLKAAAATLEQVTLSGTLVNDLTLTGGSLTNTRFRRDALGTGGGGKDSLLEESTFDNCTLADCEFLGCTFRRTTLRNLTLKGLTLRNIDFTGLILDTEEAFKKAAGL